MSLSNERTQFRHLNEQEQDAIETILNRIDRFTCNFLDILDFQGLRSVLIQYSYLGSGFTVCILFCNGKIKLGASRCSHLDRPNRIKGEMLALKRAVTSKAPPISIEIKEEEREEPHGTYIIEF